MFGLIGYQVWCVRRKSDFQNLMRSDSLGDWAKPNNHIYNSVLKKED